jgi:small conductance mechanosensitive channel
MPRPIVVVAVVCLWVALFAGTTRSQIDPNLIVQATAATTQPSTTTTQPTAVSVTVSTGSTTQPTRRRFLDDLANTQIGKLVRGEKELSLADIKDYQFWVTIAWDLTKTILSFIPRVIACFVFLFVFYLIYRMIRKLAVRKMKDDNVDTSIRDMIGGLLKWAIMGFGVVIACNQLGIPIVAMLTGVSIIGLAVGFAAQETLANFIAGIVIFLDKPFKVGDWIQVHDDEGLVNRVTFRSTRFTNLDGDVVVMPNTAMLQNRIINKSTNPVTRVNVPIGIAYKESIDRTREVLLKTLIGDKRIQSTPQPEVVVRQCADSSVNLMLHFWIREERYEDAMVWEYLEKCKKALDAANIEMPFPHMQLFLENTPALEKLAPGDGKSGRN